MIALLGTPVHAGAPYQSGEGWCGGQAPIASACQAKPYTLPSSITVDIDAHLLCLLVSGCEDGEVVVTLHGATETGTVEKSCSYSFSANSCTGIQRTGAMYVGQDIVVTGTATLRCGSTVCGSLPAAAEWSVAVY
jgi:hypothetical protein